MLISKKSLAIFGFALFLPLLGGASGNGGWPYEGVKAQFAGWTLVTKPMLSGKPYSEYPDACGELAMHDGSKIVLLSKREKDRTKYTIVRFQKGSESKVLFKDEWPDGNPCPFLSPNKDAKPRDVKTKKQWSVNPQQSFVFDEWAYRWVIAEVGGKWQKILIQSEE